MDVGMNKEIISSLILLFNSICFSCRYYFLYIILVLCDTDYYSRILFIVPEFVISWISGLLSPSPMSILISGIDLYFMFISESINLEKNILVNLCMINTIVHQ